MKKMKRRIKGNRGETIAETLVAVLIGALALMMLAGAITASSSLVTQGKNKINSYLDVNETLLSRPNSVSSSVAGTMGSTSISFTDIGIENADSKWSLDSVGVSYYQNNTFSQKPVVMYNIQ